MEYVFSAKAQLSYEADVIVVGGGLATLGHVSPLDATTKRTGEPFGGIAEEIVEDTRSTAAKTCIMTGQAAGTAAAISVRDDKPCCDIEVNKLQTALRESGVKI